MIPGILNNAYMRERIMTGFTEKSAGNVLPILPIEGAVTVGRTAWGWKRSGFLEAQERLIEEIVVAAVWLFGVKSVDKLVEKTIDNLQKKGRLKGLYTHADWSKDFMAMFLPGRKTPSIRLSPMERFVNNYGALMKNMSTKAVKLGIAVSVPLLTCGFVIPKLNQLKTEWILKKFYAGQGHSPAAMHAKGPHLRFAQAGGVTAPALVNNQPVSYATSTHAPQPFQFPEAPSLTGPSRYDAPQVPALNRLGTVPVAASVPRFGFSASKGAALISQMGHWINNTAYGEVLAVDAGITGGRMVTAWPRSKFESFEYGARDVGSLFFYLMSVPWIMNAGHKLLNSPSTNWLTQRFFGKNGGVAVKVDEQVVSRVNSMLVNKLEAAGVKAVTPETLNKLLLGTPPQGLSPESLSQIYRNLGVQLRQTSYDGFSQLFEQEFLAYSKSPSEMKSAGRLLQQVQQHLQSRIKGKAINAEQLQQFLNALWNQEGTFKHLTDAQRFHLSTAAKHAFQHRAGLTSAELEKTIRTVAGNASQGTRTLVLEDALKSRIGSATRTGGDKVVASALRRSLNAATLSNKFSHEAVSQLDTVVRSVERAVLEGTPIESFVKDHLQSVVREYDRFISTQGKSAKAGALSRQMAQLKQALASEAPISSRTLNKLVELLETNGRTGSKWLRWTKGPGMGHLAEEIRLVTPLLEDGVPLPKTLTHQVSKMMKTLIQTLPTNAPQMPLLQSYDDLIQGILKGKGRASILLTQSMANSVPEFRQMLYGQIKGILHGGMKREDQIYNMALRALKRMPMEAESFFDHKETRKVKSLLDHYLSLVQQRLSNVAKGRALTTKQFASEVLQPLAKTNAKWRYGTWGVALLASMWGVGVLIPKLQYWMTKTLTGSNEHPGLAAVSNKLGSNAQL